MKHIASVSFGKDSLAMLLIMLEKNMPLDEVIFYDTGKEFQAIYDARDKILPLLQEREIKYTELYPDKSFDYLMFETPVKKQGTQIIHRNGYSWCGGPCRWGTERKLKALERYCKGHIEYVGLACDEKDRLIKERRGHKRFLLDELKICEEKALEICIEKGFVWLENGVWLYDILHRASCWCCRNKNLTELQGIYESLPEYWERLVQLESQLGEQMKPSGTLKQLEERYLKTGSMKKKRNKNKSRSNLQEYMQQKSEGEV